MVEKYNLTQLELYKKAKYSHAWLLWVGIVVLGFGMGIYYKTYEQMPKYLGIGLGIFYTIIFGYWVYMLRKTIPKMEVNNGKKEITTTES